MLKKINSFIVSNNNDGYEIQIVYSIIDSNGEYINKNIIKSFFVIDENIINQLNELRNFLITKIPENG